MKPIHLTLPAAILAFTLSCANAGEKKPDADNTQRNKQDESGKTKTPMDQSNAPEDLKLVAAIRQMVVKDSTLSATAKNCKIITNAGYVTLRGPVNTVKEKATIASLATTSAGKGMVDNQLEVKAGK